MKNTKTSFIFILIAVMLFSSVSTVFAETSTIKFTDINNSWAKKHIINVFNKGLMNGMTQTEFKPQEKVSVYHAFNYIAKMANAYYKYDLTALEKEYKTSILDKYSVPAFARKEVALCLKIGVAREEDIKAITTNPNLTKQVAAIYLGRAFGVVHDPQKPVVVLKFKDDIKFIDDVFIIKEAKTHINYLINIGVLDAPTTISTKFNPDTVINREVFAKILDVASDKYVELKLGAAPATPSNDTPTPVTQPPANPETTVPPAGTGTPATQPGNNTGAVTPPSTTTPTTGTGSSAVITPAEVHTGTVEQVLPEHGIIVFQIPALGDKKPFTVASDMVCIVDGIEGSKYWNLENGDKASVYLNKEGVIIKLIIESKVKKVAGTFERINTIGKLGITIKNSKGESTTYYIKEKTSAMRQNMEIKYSEFKIGEPVSIILSGQDIVVISALDNKSVQSGMIESITFSRTTLPKIVLATADNKRVEYYFSGSIVIWVQGKEGSIFDLRPGMQADVEIENGEIIRLSIPATPAQ